MSNVVITNNATGELAAGINDTVTSLTLKSGEGALFPNPTGTEYFYVTISDNAGNIEIVKVTARSTNTMTIVRGQDGTSAMAWDADDTVSLRFNKAMYDNMVQKDGDSTIVGDWTITGDITQTGDFDASGTLNADGAATLGSTLGVTGVTTLSDNATVGGTLGVTGVTTLTDNATVGGTLGVTGVTTLSDNATVGGTLGVTGATTLTGAVTTEASCTVEGILHVGVDDTTIGNLYLYGGGTGAEGGNIRIYMGADDDTTYEYWTVDANATGNFRITRTGAAAIEIDQTTNVVDFAVMPTHGGSAPVGFASGTKMVFYQASAPTGWTAESINDKALRVVSAGGTGGTDGGTTAFSSVLASRTLTGDQLPVHYHAAGGLVTDTQGAHTHTQTIYNTATYGSSGLSGMRKAATTSQTGSAGAHAHSVTGNTGTAGSGNPIDFAVQYSDVIICEKD